MPDWLGKNWGILLAGKMAFGMKQPILDSFTLGIIMCVVVFTGLNISLLVKTVPFGRLDIFANGIVEIPRVNSLTNRKPTEITP